MFRRFVGKRRSSTLGWRKGTFVEGLGRARLLKADFKILLLNVNLCHARRILLLNVNLCHARLLEFDSRFPERVFKNSTSSPPLDYIQVGVVEYMAILAYL
jgi:hypothetical protein